MHRKKSNCLVTDLVSSVANAGAHNDKLNQVSLIANTTPWTARIEKKFIHRKCPFRIAS